MNNHFPRTLLRISLALVLVLLTLLPPVGGSAVYAQNLHPACLNDQGTPAVPRITLPGSEVLILNFNHALNQSVTTGCVGVRDWNTPNLILYHLVTCPLINNVNNAAVGNGNAPFDGVFWIECPAGTLSTTYPEDFYIYARADFPQKSVKGVQWHTLLEHANVSFKVNIDSNWHPTLQSRYDTTTFTNFDASTTVENSTVQLKSDLDSDNGSHRVNGALLTPTQKAIPAFTFDGGQPIIIGTSAANRPWTLHIILVDPPSAYS